MANTKFNITYPMVLSNSGNWSTYKEEGLSELKFMLAFRLNERLFYKDYGTDLTILQKPSHLEELEKIGLMRFRVFLEKYLKNRRIQSIVINKDKTRRTVEINIKATHIPSLKIEKTVVEKEFIFGN